LLLVVLLMVVGATIGWGCSRHRGSSLEGPVAEAWAARWSGEAAEPSDIAVDASGNVYITGQTNLHIFSDVSFSDYLTRKYDSSGREVWSAEYDGPSGSADRPGAIAVDASGNVYVTGGCTATGPFGHGGYDLDYATIKYGPDGTQTWVARYNGPGYFLDEAMAIAVDGSGNVYVTGTSQTEAGFSPRFREYVTIKYDSDGNELWVAQYHGPVQGSDRANAIAVGSDGSVYVTGYSAARQYENDGATGILCDYATIKYDTKGNQVWVARYSALDGGHSVASALALDRSDNVYVTGNSRGSDEKSNQDCVTVKYDAAGNELWVARHDGPASGKDSANDIAVDAWGNAYVTGYVTCDAEGFDQDYATIKYDANGDELWVRRYGSFTRGDAYTIADQAHAITVDTSGDVYVTGGCLYGIEVSYSGQVRFAVVDYDCVTTAYNTDGTQLWVARYAGGSPSPQLRDIGRAIALDSMGNVYVMGESYDDNGVNGVTIKYVPE